MTLADLADFLDKRGLVLRSVTFGVSPWQGISGAPPMPTDLVASFTCDPKPAPAEPTRAGGRPFDDAPAQPDALDEYLNRKQKNAPAAQEGEVTP